MIWKIILFVLMTFVIIAGITFPIVPQPKVWYEFPIIPGLEEKISILNKVIELAEILEIENPKVAALSAIETVNPAIPSTVDAAVLSKMSERQQFKALIEGPLDIDAILNLSAATRKNVNSPVSEDMDIILCPDIETAYSLSQAFTFLGNFPTAGVLLGTPFPVIINPEFIPLNNKAVEVAINALRCEFRNK